MATILVLETLLLAGLIYLLVSTRKRHKKELEKAEEKSKRDHTENIATLAHELRNPLGPIQNQLDILRLVITGERDWAEVEKCQQVMERQTTAMAKIIDDLLDFIRVKKHKIVLKKECVDLRVLVDRALGGLNSTIADRFHKIIIDAPGKPIVVEVESHRIEQVLNNLLVNACKYTEPGGTISIGLTTESGQAVLKVRDSGIGISADMLPKVFDMFSQSEKSLDRSQGGLGIGLSLVKKIIELHDGTVHANSGGPGLGSEFTIKLQEATGEITKPESQKLIGPGKNLNLLVVDDNEDAAKSLGSLLQMYGHSVEIAYDGIKAIQSVSDHRPDAILLDLGLPGMDGFTVCKNLRKRYGPDLTIIAVTGYNSEEDKKTSAKVGFNAHLTKPVDIHELNTLLVR